MNFHRLLEQDTRHTPWLLLKHDCYYYYKMIPNFHLIAYVNNFCSFTLKSCVTSRIWAMYVVLVTYHHTEWNVIHYFVVKNLKVNQWPMSKSLSIKKMLRLVVLNINDIHMTHGMCFVMEFETMQAM